MAAVISSRPATTSRRRSHHLDDALAVNPKNVRALLVQASHRDRPEPVGRREARPSTGARGQPQDDSRRSRCRRPSRWLRDDTGRLRGRAQKALRDQPAPTRGSTRSWRGRRCASTATSQAIDLEKQAVELEPDYYEAMARSALGYLRLGMEKEGLEWLDKAWKGDEYNVRTVQHARTCSRRRSPRSTPSRRARTSGSATPTTRRRRCRATSSRRSSARSPTWSSATASRPKTPVVRRAVRQPDRLRRADGRACPTSARSASASARSSPRCRRRPATSTGAWCCGTSSATCSRSSCRTRGCRAGSPRACREYETLIARPDVAARERLRRLRRDREQGTLPSIGDAQLRVHAARHAAPSSSRTTCRR